MYIVVLYCIVLHMYVCVCVRSHYYILTITHYACLHSEMDYNTEFDYFLRGKESLRMDVNVPEMARLSKEQVQMLYVNNYSSQPMFHM